MTNSPSDEITGRHPPAGLVAIALGAVGALVALLLGLLTFGVQATVRPDGLPLAIGATDPALAPMAVGVAGRGDGEVSWRTVASRQEAEALLDRKEVYGALLIGRGPGGPTATVLLSGAVNPTGAQVAQAALTQVAGAVVAAARAQTPNAPASPAPPVQVVTVHPTSAAGRALPLAASALLWLATMIASILAVVVVPRLRGRPLGRQALLVTAASSALLGTGVVVGLARLWDAGIAFGWEAIGLLALVGAAFALLQTGVLRWLGVRGLIILVPLYLMAPAVAGTAPELLDPIYRAALWSWTPFRFSTEALRSLLLLGPDAPDVMPALWVFAGIGLAGLLLTLVPRPDRRSDAVVGEAAAQP